MRVLLVLKGGKIFEVEFVHESPKLIVQNKYYGEENYLNRHSIEVD